MAGRGPADRLAVMKPATWEYAEGYLAEDDILTTARARGAEVNATPIGAAGGAALRVLATALHARAIVEIGTGCGVSGIWMLRGMTRDGVLTSIDAEPEHHRLARRSFAEAGFPTARVRLITGRALEVLPRLTDGHYDVVFCDAAKAEYPDYLTEALRLLRPGGVVAFDNALWHDRVPDPAFDDADTRGVREVLRLVREEESLVPVLLPVGDGLLVAAKRPA